MLVVSPQILKKLRQESVETRVEPAWTAQAQEMHKTAPKGSHSVSP